MAELTTDPRRLSPALSSRRAGNGHTIRGVQRPSHAR